MPSATSCQKKAGKELQESEMIGAMRRKDEDENIQKENKENRRFWKQKD